MNRFKLIFLFIFAVVVCGCNRIDSNRIPYAPVRINLNNDGLWNTYGVGAPGMSSRFIKPDIPSRAFYTVMSYTGFGGVLLFCNSQGVPCAYDLSCPVEAKQNIRIFVNDALEAECPECASKYNILLGDGGAISGPALNKYGLQRYSVVPNMVGGYINGYNIVR